MFVESAYLQVYTCMIYYRQIKKNTHQTEGNKMTMTIEEMKKYIKEELEEEYRKLMMGKPNNYGYLFMIANDMGLVEQIGETNFFKAE